MHLKCIHKSTTHQQYNSTCAEPNYNTRAKCTAASSLSHKQISFFLWHLNGLRVRLNQHEQRKVYEQEVEQSGMSLNGALQCLSYKGKGFSKKDTISSRRHFFVFEYLCFCVLYLYLCWRQCNEVIRQRPWAERWGVARLGGRGDRPLHNHQHHQVRSEMRMRMVMMVIMVMMFRSITW